MEPIISLIVAAGQGNWVIGKDGDLPWRKIKADMKWFRQKTTGHPVIMGRKTWESISPEYRPLPDRTNFILTRDRNFEAANAHVCSSLESALHAAEQMPGSEEIFVIGGGEIYAEAFPLAKRLYVTTVHGDFEGDTFFPETTGAFKELIYVEMRSDTNPPITFAIFER